MKRILVHEARCKINRYYAVNDSGLGLFERLPHQAAYTQMLGNGQFFAKSKRSLILKLRRRGIIEKEDIVVKGGDYGWD